jgi:hypothetical protein
MSKYIGLLLVITMSVLLTGCASAPGGIAASNTPLHAKPYNVIGPTSGSDCRYAILGIIPVTKGNTTREAVEKARENIGADALIEITVENCTQFWILFTKTITRVDAQGIRFKDKWEGDKDILR